MAQIKTGTANVENGNATVTFTGVTVAGSALIGHAFNIRGEDAVYSLAADATAPGGVQTIQLTAPYAGTTGAKNFQITTSFSPISGLYEPDVNDVDIAILLKHQLVRKIDGGLGSGHTIQEGNTDKPARGRLSFASPATVTDDAGNNRSIVTIPEASESSAGLQSATDKKNLDNVLYLFGLGGAVDQTAEIASALAAAVAQNKTLVVIGKLATNGGYLIDDPIAIRGEQATFVLTANAILFDFSVQCGFKASGFDVEVPDANTAAVIRYTTSGDRTTGRGWGPFRSNKLSDMRIYSASARDWNAANGIYPGIVNTKGSWIGLELWGDTTISRTGINYSEFENIHIEFPYYGIKLTKANVNSLNFWAGGLYFKGIFIHGYKHGIYGRTVNFNANTLDQIMLQPLRDDGSIGLDLDGWCNSNVINVNVFHDSGWNGQTRGNHQSMWIEGSGNIITGYIEDSEETPSVVADRNCVTVDVNTTNTAVWNGGSPAANMYSQRVHLFGPVGINTEPDPNTALHVVREYTSPSTANITSLTETYGDQARFMFWSANGTKFAPTKKLEGENYAVFGGRGYSGTAWPTFSPADVRFYADEDQDLGWGSGIKFMVTPKGDHTLTAATQAMQINSAGRVILSSSPVFDDGVNRLQVDGNAKASEFIGGGAQLTGIDASQIANLPTGLPSQSGNSGKYLTTNGSTASWASVVGGLELSRIVSGSITSDETDSIVEFTASGTYTLTATLANKKAIVVKNTHASDSVTINTDGYAILNGSPAGIYSLLAGQFCIMGEEPNNIDSWRVVLTGGVNTPDKRLIFSDGSNNPSGAANTAWDNTNSRLSIGPRTDPQGAVHINSTSSNSATKTLLVSDNYTTATGGGLLFLHHNNDAYAAPASADRLGGVFFGALAANGISARNSAAIMSYATEAWTDNSAQGTKVVIATTSNGSATRTERFSIEQNGNPRGYNQAIPASSTATGTAGEICWDANYIYVATGTNTWKRAGLSTW